MSLLKVNQNNFVSEVLTSEKPVLLDFFAPWCGPCKMFSPIVDKIAEENADTIKVGKVDVDEAPELARKFGIMGVPALVLIVDGKPVAASVGAKPKHMVEQMIRQAAI